MPSRLPRLLPDLLVVTPASLLESEGTVDARECDEHNDELEKDCLSFLNGLAMFFTPFLTDALRDTALLREDLVEEFSVDFTMMENWTDIPLTKLILYFVGANSQYINLFQHYMSCGRHACAPSVKEGGPKLS